MWCGWSVEGVRDVKTCGLNSQVKGFEDWGIWQWEELAGAVKTGSMWVLGSFAHSHLDSVVSKPFMVACSVQAQALHLGGGGLEGRG